MKKAIDVKTYNLLNYGVFTHSIYDNILKPFRDYFGGKVKFGIIGAAPIAAEILTFLKVILGIHFIESYG